MTPISFSWDSRKRSIFLKWDGLFSLGWENGKTLTTILGFPIRIPIRQRKSYFPKRWVYIKRSFSLLKKWKVKRVEGTVSFPDPMINGVLYGWTSAVNAVKSDRAFNVTVNFLGENWSSGEAVIAPKTLFYHVWGWIFPCFGKKRGRS